MNNSIQINNFVDFYKNTISKYGQLSAFQIDAQMVTYDKLNIDVMKLIASFKDGERKYIQICTENSYYFAIAYFAVILSNNIAVLCDDDKKISDNNIKIDIKLTDEIIDKKLQVQYLKKVLYKEDLKNDCVCTIIFSSGTTGKSKAILLSAENILETVIACANKVTYFSTDRCINVIPLIHIFGLIGDFLITFHVGACMCVMSSKYEFYDAIKKYKPTFLNLPPILIESLFYELDKFKEKKICIRRIMCGGADISEKIIDKYKKYNIKVLRCYGLTESPCISLCSDYEKENKGVGKVLDCNKILLDELGQIFVSGKSVMLGYFNQKESPFVNINNQLFLKTNDVGTLDENNNLILLGRADNSISLKNGEKCTKECIEEKINNISGIKESIIYVKSGKIIANVVVYDSNNDIEKKIKEMTFGGSKIYSVNYVKNIKRNVLGKVIRNEQ